MNTYPSKQDWWIVGLMRLATAMLLVAVVSVWLSPTPLLARLALCGFMLAIAGFSLHVLHATAYDVSDKDVIVRAGIIRWRVPIDAILSIQPSRNPLSGPALSLDRLHVRYRGSRWGVLISPDDREAFLADLAGRSFQLELQDGALVRRNDSAGQAN